MENNTGIDQNDIARDHIPVTYRRSANKTASKAGGWAFAALSLLFGLLQIAYLFFSHRSGYEYIYDWMFYAVNAAIPAFAFLSVLLFFHGKKPAVFAAAVTFAALLCLDLFAFFSFGLGTASIVSVSPDLTHRMILKQEDATGKVTAYRSPILVFARRYEQFSDTAGGPLKIQWLAPDVCAVTYTDTNGFLHQYVGTFGDRGNGITYYEVKDAIRGDWAMNAKNADGNTLEANDTGITIKSGDTTETFDYKDCKQFGTLALVLYRGNLPQWTITLDSNCKILNEFRILADGGTITLCRVSMDKTAPFSYFRTNDPLAGVASAAAPETVSVPPASASPTKNLTSDFSDLKKYGPKEVVIFITPSQDFFEIGKAAVYADMKRPGVANIDTILQITQMKLLAGDLNDFLIEIQSSLSSQLGPSQYNVTYRIQKGNGVFGAADVFNVQGTEGLKALDPPQIKDMSKDNAFRLFIPRSMFELTPEEVQQQELAAAGQLKDLLEESPDLSDFDSMQGLVKVQSDSNDMFMIARLALEEHLKKFAAGGTDRDVQMTDMFIFAGDANEFIIYVQYKSPGTAYARLRIKKGDGVYLAMVSGYDEIGPAGLVPIDPPKYKDASNDPAYHFFVPAE